MKIKEYSEEKSMKATRTTIKYLFYLNVFALLFSLFIKVSLVIIVFFNMFLLGIDYFYDKVRNE